MDFPESRGMARSVTRARALPAPHLPPGTSARSRKSESASPPFFPPHDGRDARPIETRLLVLAWQLQRYALPYARYSERQYATWLMRIFDQHDRFAFR